MAQREAKSTAPSSTERSVWDAPLLLRLWHLASTDAPTVAVVWSMGFGWAAHVSLPVWALVLLALVAWAIYVGDRLLDARMGFRTQALQQLQERHHFHWRHRGVLIPVAGLAGLIAGWMVMNLLPHNAVEPDSIVAVATLAYFSGVHSRLRLPTTMTRLMSREFLVGTLFTSGCALPVLSQLTPGGGADAPLRVLLFTVAFYAALAWLNCRAIGRWESASRGSTQIGVFGVALTLSLAGFLAAAVFVTGHPRCSALMAAGAISSLLLAGLDRLRPRMTPLALRALADLVLLTPVVVLIAAGWQ